jgi:molecular chaperone HtpG
VLQTNPLVRKIRKDITKRLFRELEKKANKDAEAYEAFWTEFGAVLKEGLYEDADVREPLFKLVRFKTTSGDMVSLADYVGRMKDAQSAIYYISGAEADSLAQSPQLEGYRARDIEVLLLSDAVDDFWINSVQDFEGKPFQSVTQGSADLDDIPETDAKDDADKPDEANVDSLVALLKLSLGETVKDVRTSSRLRESPVCLVADESGVDRHLERLLKQHGKIETTMAPILEINPRHDLIKVISGLASKEGAADALADAAQLLFDQAKIIEGEIPADPAGFSRRLSAIMAKGLSA